MKYLILFTLLLLSFPCGEKYEKLIKGKNIAPPLPLKIIVSADICTPLRQPVYQAQYITWVREVSDTGNLVKTKKYFSRAAHPAMIFLGNGLGLDANQTLFFNPIYPFNMFGDKSYILLKEVKPLFATRYSGEFKKKKRAVSYLKARIKSRDYPFRYDRDYHLKVSYDEKKISWDYKDKPLSHTAAIVFTNQGLTYTHRTKKKVSDPSPQELPCPGFSLLKNEKKIIIQAADFTKKEKKILKKQHNFFTEKLLAEQLNEDEVHLYFRRAKRRTRKGRYAAVKVIVKRSAEAVTFYQEDAEKETTFRLVFFEDHSISLLDQDRNGWLWLYSEAGITIKFMERGRTVKEERFIKPGAKEKPEPEPKQEEGSGMFNE